MNEKYIDAFFDIVAFVDTIDRVRRARKMSWLQVEVTTGATYQNIYRMKRIKSANMSTRILTSLVLWSGIDPRPFMKDRNKQEEVSA